MVFLKTRSTVSAGSLVLWGNSEIQLKQMIYPYFTQWATRLKGLYTNFLELLYEDSSQNVLVPWYPGCCHVGTVLSMAATKTGSQKSLEYTEYVPMGREGSQGHLGFPGGSDGNDSACYAGDPGLIPGSGRSPGEGNGNPLQYSCLENPWTVAWWATIHGVTKSRT